MTQVVSSTEQKEELVRWLRTRRHAPVPASRARACGVALVALAVAVPAAFFCCLGSAALGGPPPAASLGPAGTQAPSLLYYATAAVLAVPVTLIFALVNWMSLKYFRHN
eukprot:m51a1_g6970 hypothetical protein (109) ;mRNA; r:103294-103620